MKVCQNRPAQAVAHCKPMRIHLVDGTFELYRAHFSKRPSKHLDTGQDVKASVGVVQSLLQLLDDPEEQVTHLAVAFDNPIASFRNKLFSGYKGDDGVPPELRAQFDLVEESVRALGVVVWSMNEFEADDAIATAALRFGSHSQVTQVRILSPDKDLGQCLKGDTVVQVDRIRQRLMTESTQRQDKGIEATSVPDFLALVGDEADGIPGLQGWGTKGAAAVLQHHPHLEDISDDVNAWRVKPRGAERLALTLSQRRSEAILYRTLATLRSDVPLHESLEELHWRGPVKSQWAHWVSRMQAPKLSDRPRLFCD